MTNKQIELPEIGNVVITKKRGMKSIRLKIKPDNSLSVSAPWFVPQSEIIKFVKSKQEWIISNKTQDILILKPDMPIGLAGYLTIRPSGSENSRVSLKPRGVDVRLAKKDSIYSIEDRIIKQVTRYLSLEVEESVFPRLLELSNHYDLPFGQVRVKKLTGRWGSCDSKKNIVINSYLVQLEEELVDYVLVHELAHTKHLNHSKEFWSLVESIVPDYKNRRKALKQYQPRIYDQSIRPRYNDAYA